MTPRASAPPSFVPSGFAPRPRHALVWGGALGAAVLLSGCHSVITSEYAHTATSSYVVGGHLTSLRVDASGGEIDVTASARTTQVKVTEIAHYNGSRPATKHTVAGGVLDLDSMGCGHHKCTVRYRVQVPAALAARLASHGGKVIAHGVDGTLDVDSAGGKVTADGTAAKNVTVRSAGGSVSLALSRVPDHVGVDSAGGSCEVHLPSDSYAVAADADGGSEKVAVRVDPASAHTVKLDSHGGNIRVLGAS